jgi:hypothetical protein
MAMTTDGSSDDVAKDPSKRSPYSTASYTIGLLGALGIVPLFGLGLACGLRQCGSMSYAIIENAFYLLVAAPLAGLVLGYVAMRLDEHRKEIVLPAYFFSLLAVMFWVLFFVMVGRAQTC